MFQHCGACGHSFLISTFVSKASKVKWVDNLIVPPHSSFWMQPKCTESADRRYGHVQAVYFASLLQSGREENVTKTVMGKMMANYVSEETVGKQKRWQCRSALIKKTLLKLCLNFHQSF